MVVNRKFRSGKHKRTFNQNGMSRKTQKVMEGGKPFFKKTRIEKTFTHTNTPKFAVNNRHTIITTPKTQDNLKKRYVNFHTQGRFFGKFLKKKYETKFNKQITNATLAGAVKRNAIQLAMANKLKTLQNNRPPTYSPPRPALPPALPPAVAPPRPELPPAVAPQLPKTRPNINNNNLRPLVKHPSRKVMNAYRSGLSYNILSKTGDPTAKTLATMVRDSPTLRFINAGTAATRARLNGMPSKNTYV